MYKAKLYNVQKKKSDVLGLWKDETGKIFRDNVILKEYSSFVKFQRGIAKLFSQGEKAVFYEKLGMGFIEYKNGKIETLPYKIELHEKKLKASFVKILLFQHGGVTIKREKQGFKIIIFKA